MSTTAPTRPVERAPASRRRRWRILRIVLALAALGLAATIVASKQDEIAGAGTYLERLHAGWIVAAAGAELASILAFAALQQRLLRCGGTPLGLGSLTGITFAGNALQNSLPGGGAFAAAYAFRQFRRRGADEVLSAWVLIALSLLSGVALAIVAAVGLALSQSQGSELDLGGVVLGVLVLAAVAALLVRRGAIPIVVGRGLALSRRLTPWPRGNIDEIVGRTQQRLVAVTPSSRDWAMGLAMALANWAGDCSCLALAFLAVGAHVPWRGLLLAYGAAQLASNLPITPGGLGVVEGSLTIALVAYGGGQLTTVAAVILYRMMSFWALLAIGWPTLGGLSWRNARRDRALETLEAAA